MTLKVDSASNDFDSILDIQHAFSFHNGLLCELQQVELRQVAAQSNLAVFDDNVQSTQLVIAGLLQTGAD